MSISSQHAATLALASLLDSMSMPDEAQLVRSVAAEPYGTSRWPIEAALACCEKLAKEYHAPDAAKFAGECAFAAYKQAIGHEWHGHAHNNHFREAERRRELAEGAAYVQHGGKAHRYAGPPIAQVQEAIRQAETIYRIAHPC